MPMSASHTTQKCGDKWRARCARARPGLTKSIRQRRRKLAAPKGSHFDAYVVAYIRFRVMCTLYPLCRMFANIFLVILNAIQAQIQVTTSQHTHTLFGSFARSIHRQTQCMLEREQTLALCVMWNFNKVHVVMRFVRSNMHRRIQMFFVCSRPVCRALLSIA